MSLLGFATLLVHPMAFGQQPKPADLASPMVGTSGHGHAFPGATRPFGLVQLSPDTRTDTWDGCSGYHYSDSTIQGFSHTHLSGTGCGGLGDILLMPEVGDAVFAEGKPGAGYVSAFSHEREFAKPGYYRVYLDNPKVTAEMTASDRVGFHRYTFPESNQSRILIDLVHGIQNDCKGGTLKVESSTTISGSRVSDGWGGRRTVYYVIEFSKPFDSTTIQANGNLADTGADQASGLVKATANFKTAAGEAIEVKVGISATSVEGARKNLQTEGASVNFEKAHENATAAWNKALGTVLVEAKDPKIVRTYYSNLYLSYIAPNTFGDADGTYRGLDHKVHPNPGFNNYSTFSLWDIYRAELPLLTLLQPQRVDDMVQSLIGQYDQNGYKSTPIWPLWDNETWCMIGYHTAPFVVDAYFKGFKGFDPEKAYQALKTTAMQDRNGLDTFKSLGWVASRSGEQAASKTLEYTIDDWCIARMADALGHKEDAAYFYKRAANYRNLFDSNVQFFRGRKANGEWRAPFTAIGLVGDEYTEADAWQYAFSVQHDVPGLMALYGGPAKFAKRMDEMFAADSTINTSIPDITGRMGQFALGDEQCHHVAYLYDYAGQPWKTQKWVREAMTKFFDDTVEGQCGNIDCGQMAAWYALSAIGLYPVNPAAGRYDIGSPMVDKTTFQLDDKFYGGRTFTVEAVNNSPKNVYIQSATLNGRPLNRTYITHAELVAGGTLKFYMGANPNLKWATGSKSVPAPDMPAGFKYDPLPKPSTNKRVTLKLPIRIVCGSDETFGQFFFDPNMVAGSTNSSGGPIDVSAPNAAPSQVYQSERYGSDFAYRFKVPAGHSYTVRLHFAELFDSEVGMRVENISINGKVVLPKFDPFAVAGKLRKAVVKEFSSIQADANGEIVIRIQADPNSPDQNAKISGIEILP